MKDRLQNSSKLVVWFGVSCILALACACQSTERAKGSNRSASSIFVYGCGVNTNVPIASGQTLELNQVLAFIGPLPEIVNQVAVICGSVQYVTDPVRAQTPVGDGKVQVRRGDKVGLFHAGPHVQ